jgi:hypothetical protein
MAKFDTKSGYFVNYFKKIQTHFGASEHIPLMLKFCKTRLYVIFIIIMEVTYLSGGYYEK